MEKGQCTKESWIMSWVGGAISVELEASKSCPMIKPNLFTVCANVHTKHISEESAEIIFVPPLLE